MRLRENAQLVWPWQDRHGRFSGLKAGTFALLLLPAVWIIVQAQAGEFGPVPLGGMTYWSGLWATSILLLALAVTPAVAIARWRSLILVRRMIGLTALAYAVAHIFIYFALRFWNFASIAHEMTTRLSLVLATVATFGLAGLGVTSVDAAVRRMGAKGWQALHNTIYVFTALALIHYLMSPDTYPDQFLTSGIFFWLMAWRLLNRRGRGNDATALAILAVAACVFTASLEVGWTWAYHGYEPQMTIRNNFELDLGVAPLWKVLIGGFVMSFVAALRRGPRPDLPAAGIVS